MAWLMAAIVLVLVAVMWITSVTVIADCEHKGGVYGRHGGQRVPSCVVYRVK